MAEPDYDLFEDDDPRYWRQFQGRLAVSVAVFCLVLLVVFGGNWYRPLLELLLKRPSHAIANDEIHYRDCTQAREAGAAPIDKDQPGYRTELDPDANGIACETPY